MVVIKIAILIFFVIAALTSFSTANFENFSPHGISGITSAAGLIFFAYIGFDAVSTGSEESNNPSRDLPIAIVGSLTISTILYVLVAVAAVGAAPIAVMTSGPNADAPLSAVLEEGTGLSWASAVLSLGALIAITSVVLVIMYGQTRIFFAMCRDGLMPKRFAKIHPRYGTPARLTMAFGGLIALLAAFVPLTEIVELVNIGTLFAFVLVNIGVIVLRRTRPDMERPFRTPLVPVFPIIGVLLCGYLMADLPMTTWVRFFVWMAIGLVIYFAYSYSHSNLRRQQASKP
jgi:basic amino acid/polyamine antiporter, APA family